LIYNLTDSREPNEFEYALAGDSALGHLQSFLAEQFSSTFDVQMKSFDGLIVDTGFNPVMIDFNATVTFSGTSSFIPTTEEVDMLVQLAFLPPQVDALIEEYSSLSADMPFSTTQSIEFTPISLVRSDDLKLLQSEDVGGKTTIEKALISIVAFLSASLVVLLGLRYKSNRKRNLPFSVKLELVPIMPGYSFSDSHSNNIMPFNDESLSHASNSSCQFKARSSGSSFSSRGSSVVIRAV
jgi:hypothetical protein